LPALAAVNIAAAEPLVIDFEEAIVVGPDDLPNRYEEWVEKGVVFKLAHQPRESKAKGLLMIFTHLATGRKAIVCAMAAEPIPVQVTFPTPVSSVTLALWGATGTPAMVDAFDADNNVVDRAELETIPGRRVPGEPVPIFEMTVSAKRIAYIQFSGPRKGEYLAADEIRFIPVEGDSLE
jgi:hypothetical protein